VISACVLIFFALVAFIFWLGGLAEKPITNLGTGTSESPGGQATGTSESPGGQALAPAAGD